MGLFHSLLRVCSRTTRSTQNKPISPDIISHPFPLLPREYPSRGPSRRPNRTATIITPTSQIARPTSQIARPYITLHSPAPSTTDSSLPVLVPPNDAGLAGLGFGLGMDLTVESLRRPDMAHIGSGSRWDSLHSFIGMGGRKLHKPRMVEGDWELIRRDVDGVVSGPGWKVVDTVTGSKGQSQRNSTIGKA